MCYLNISINLLIVTVVNIIANIIIKIYALLKQDKKNQEWQLS